MKNFWNIFFDVLRNCSFGIVCIVVAISAGHYFRQNSFDVTDIVDAIVAFFLLLAACVGIQLFRISRLKR